MGGVLIEFYSHAREIVLFSMLSLIGELIMGNESD